MSGRRVSRLQSENATHVSVRFSRLCASAALIFVHAGIAASQSVPPDLKIDRISQDEGLPTLPVTDAYQDQDGFIWFSTWNGLYRFDGYSFEAFQHEPSDSTSVSSDWVTSTVVDRDGRQWVTTLGAGLNLLDRSTGRFVHFMSNVNDPRTLSSDELGYVVPTSDGKLWLTSSNGLNRFDPETHQVTRFVHDPDDPSSLTGSAVRILFEDRQERIWVATGNPFVPQGAGALNLLDPRTGSFESFQIRPNEPTSLDNYIQSVVQADDSTLFVAPWSGGIYTFDVNTHKFSHFANPLRLDDSAPDTKIVSFKRQPGKSILWVGTYGAGLQRLDPGNGTWAKYVYDPEDPFTIPDNRVWGVWFDAAGTMWIGTHGGLARTSVTGKLPRVMIDGLGRDEYVTNILEDQPGRLFLATDRNALLDWHMGSGRSRRYQLPSDHCTGWEFPGVGITKSKTGNLWAVGPCGVFAFDPDRGEFKRLDLDIAESDIGSDQAIRIMEDAEGLIWIAAQPSVIRIDPVRRSYELFGSHPDDPSSLSNSDVEHVVEDRFDRIWVGTAGGLDEFDRRTSGWKHSQIGKFDESSAVTSILDALDGTLWLTTDRDGLVRFRPESNRQDFFGIREGLHSNTLMRSARDQNGSIWVLSPTGLDVIDPESHAVRRFNAIDGLVDVRFGRHDLVALSDGRIVIGGKGALNMLDPQGYSPSSSSPNIVLQSILAGGKPVTPSDVEEKAQEGPASIRLPYDENDLVFDYVGLRVANPQQIRYEYQLVGIDESWVAADDQRTARYTDLGPGEYVFKVRGATGSGPWSKVKSLSITIRSPWWRTSWAYFLYFVCISGALVLFVRMQARALVRAEQQRARQRELEQARDLKRAYDELEKTHKELKETQARLDEIKSRFFANISHEFRTPLTLIIGQTEALLATAGERDRGKLEMLARNGRRLLRLINQLLDLSKLEAGGMELRPTTFDLIPFFKNLVGSFESLAHQKGISLRFTSDLETLPARFERDKLEKIFVNLVSNALKFTGDGDVSVSLSTESEGDAETVVVRVSDTGVGIPAERLPHVFDRFYQVGSTSRRPDEGTGIGLALVKELAVLHGGTVEVESEVDKGSVFTVRLPVEEGTADEHVEPPVEVTEWDVDAGIPELPRMGEITADAADDEHRADGLTEDELVLVVEDNHDVRAYIVENLTDFRVQEAGNGETGLNLAIELTPDLIITDVMMPEMDGFELARHLRSDQRTSHIPIIMLTARAGEEDRIEGLETGIDDYLIKPFSPKELNVRVRNLIDQRRRLRERFGTATRITPSDVSAVSMDQEFVQRVLEAIEHNFGDDQYSVEVLADEIGMSVSQLNRKLGALIDQSAGKLIRSMRLQRAADLLTQQAGTVGEIAYQVGFGSQASFATAFKRQFGVSPSEYSRTES